MHELFTIHDNWKTVQSEHLEKAIHQDGKGGLFPLETDFPSSKCLYSVFVCLLVLTRLLLVLDKFSSIKNMSIASGSSLTCIFSDYFLIHKQVTDLFATLPIKKVASITKVEKKEVKKLDHSKYIYLLLPCFSNGLPPRTCFFLLLSMLEKQLHLPISKQALQQVSHFRIRYTNVAIDPLLPGK
jgi:hypothetical protein